MTHLDQSKLRSTCSCTRNGSAGARLPTSALATLILLSATCTGGATLAPAPAYAMSKVEIVAMVGDMPITNLQVEARAGLMMQQSKKIREQAANNARDYFKNQIQTRWKKTASSESFRSKLREYVMAKRPTSREEQKKYVQEYVRQRQKTLQKQLQGEARAHGSKSVQGSMKKEALENLVEETLKLYEAKRLSVLVSPDEAKKSFAQIAQRNKKTVKQFEADLRKSGIVPMTLRDKIRADASWRNVIRKQYGFQLAYMQSQLDRYLGEDGDVGGADGEVRLAVKRIRVGSSAGGAGLVKAMQEAEQLQGRITGCESLPAVASAVPGARVEDLGERTSDGFGNPVVAELLTKASIGEPIPPQIDGGNVDVFVLCGREKGEASKKPKRKADPRQKEFELLARRHLNDIRREVPVEYR